MRKTCGVCYELICLEGYKTLGQGVINKVNTINTQYGNYNYIMDVYWNGY